MSKVLDLGHCKEPKDFARFATSHGLEHKRTNGGHAIYGNQKGSFPIPTHGTLSPYVRQSITKSIMKLLGLLLLGLIPIFCILTMFWS